MTPQQKKLYDIIKAELDETGVCPSFEEMAEAMGLASKSGIHWLLGGLEERGYIRRLHFRNRAIEIVGHVPTALRRNETTLPADARRTAILIAQTEIIRAAKALKKAPWHKEPCVSITENSYQALRKALAKLGAV